MRFALLFLILATLARATTYTAASASSSAVQAAIDSVSADGDVVSVPAGSGTWTTAVNANAKNFNYTIQGAGSSSTLITLNVAGCSFNVANSGTKIVRVTGFGFTKGAAVQTEGMVQVSDSLVPASAGTVNFRIDNCTFTTIADGSRSLGIFSVYGLIDHNTFTVTTTGSCQSIQIYGSPDGIDNGFTPHTRAITLGTVNAVYVESNTINYAGNVPVAEDSIDCYGGARFVIRYNTFTCCSHGWHGFDSGNRRGVCSFEVYNNTYNNSDAANNKLRKATVRSGTGVFFGNTYTGTPGWDGVTLQYYRAYLTSGISWPICDGSNYKFVSANPADATSASTSGVGGFDTATNTTLGTFNGTTFANYIDGSGTAGYPGRDQPGQGLGLATQAIYVWSNGSLDTSIWAGSLPPNPDDTKLQVFLQAGREWVETASTSAPGYSAYTFPYPTAGGTTAAVGISGKITPSGKFTIH